MLLDHITRHRMKILATLILLVTIVGCNKPTVSEHDNLVEPTDDTYGDVIELEPIQVKAGKGEIKLELSLPDGHKINDTAPTSIRWVENNLVQIEAQQPLVQREYPASLEATFKRGKTVLDLSLDLYYCKIGQESLCLIQKARLYLPLEIEDTGQESIVVQYVIEPTFIDGSKIPVPAGP